MSEKVPGEMCLPSSSPRRGPCLWLASGLEAGELSLAGLGWAYLGSQAQARSGENPSFPALLFFALWGARPYSLRFCPTAESWSVRTTRNALASTQT